MPTAGQLVLAFAPLDSPFDFPDLRAFARIFDVSVLSIIGQGIFAAIGMVAMKKVVRVMFPELPEQQRALSLYLLP